jgi:hypothetical protein
VQEHTASTVPDTLAIEYEIHLFAFAPKYLITDSWLMKTEIAPAIRNAGIRQRITCSCAYQIVRLRPSLIDPITLGASRGRK